ncbi:19506_t:CDS:2, partial [Racocetra fulgida]
KLCWSSTKQIILYEWTQFDNDATFTNMTQSPLVFESQITWVYKYRQCLMVTTEKQIYQDEKEIENLITLEKQVANSNNYDKTILKKRATQLKSEGWENAQQIIQSLEYKLKITTSELQNTYKRLYRLQKKVLNLQEILEREFVSS